MAHGVDEGARVGQHSAFQQRCSGDRQRPCTDTQDRAGQIVEATFRDERGNLCAKAREPHSFMEDDGAGGLVNRSGDGGEIQRLQRANVYYLDLDAILGGQDIRRRQGFHHHRAIGDDAGIRPRAPHMRDAQRHNVIGLWHVANGITEVLLTGDTAAKVTAAAQGAVSGATVDRVENDAEGATYEAHMTKSDGSKVTVKVNADFSVASVEDGMK